MSTNFANFNFPAPDSKPGSTERGGSRLSVGAAGDTARRREDAGNSSLIQARAVQTLDGRFAVVQGGVTLGELHCEATAIRVAAAINQGPVRRVSAAGRFDPPNTLNDAKEEVAA